MKAKENPFKPTAGGEPPLLIGRGKVIRDFEKGLDNGVGAPGRIMLVTGARGTGKTVIKTLPGFPQKINYLRKIDPFVFEELLLEGFEAHGFRTIRNKRYTGDGGIDGQVIIGKYRYLIQAKRYRGHIALQHVQEFEKLLKRHNCRGLFCHTGKTGAGSKSVSIASERMEIISGQRLIDLLTPGSSFTIATAPQTMMKRTAATLETSTIVKDAGKENRYHES